MITLENLSIILSLFTIVVIDVFCMTLFNNLKNGHRNIAFLKFFFCFILVIVSFILAYKTQNQMGLYLAFISIGGEGAMLSVVTTTIKKKIISNQLTQQPTRSFLAGPWSGFFLLYEYLLQRKRHYHFNSNNVCFVVLLKCHNHFSGSTSFNILRVSKYSFTKIPLESASSREIIASYSW